MTWFVYGPNEPLKLNGYPPIVVIEGDLEQSVKELFDKAFPDRQQHGVYAFYKDKYVVKAWNKWHTKDTFRWKTLTELAGAPQTITVERDFLGLVVLIYQDRSCLVPGSGVGRVMDIDDDDMVANWNDTGAVKTSEKTSEETPVKTGEKIGLYDDLLDEAKKHECVNSGLSWL